MRSQSQSTSNQLWAITSYFNPCGYRSRYENYQTFQQHLQVPLLTVELAYGDTFELSDADASQLIQIRSDQVMWQKERLLNMALLALPPECERVAWVDCDILFGRDDWPQLVNQALDQFAFVQCFSQVHHLNRLIDAAQPLAAQSYFAGQFHPGPGVICPANQANAPLVAGRDARPLIDSPIRVEKAITTN